MEIKWAASGDVTEMKWGPHCKQIGNRLYLIELLHFSAEQEAQGIAKFEGRFVCMLCGYKSKYSSHAKLHFRTQHLPQQPATCHVCQRVFRNPDHRDDHRLKKHGITKAMMKEAAKQNLPIDYA